MEVDISTTVEVDTDTMLAAMSNEEIGELIKDAIEAASNWAVVHDAIESAMPILEFLDLVARFEIEVKE